jgi:hypothetical protein
VVLTVRSEVAGEALTYKDGEEQVSPVGEPLTEQAKLTLPLNPEGVTVKVLAPLFPAVTEMGPLLPSVKLPEVAAVTVIETVVVAVILPVAVSEAVTVAV